MSLVHKNITVKGKVQGVYFRASARQAAGQLGITGIIRNEADGSVYAEAEGDAEKIQKFITWCNTGSPASTVASVNISDGPLKGFKSFEVIR